MPRPLHAATNARRKHATAAVELWGGLSRHLGAVEHADQQRIAPLVAGGPASSSLRAHRHRAVALAGGVMLTVDARPVRALMPIALGLPLAALAFAAWSWTSYCVVVRLDPDAAAHARLAETALVQLWLGNALFALLMALGLFRWSCAAPLALVITVVAHHRLGPPARRQLALDWARGRDLAAELRRPLPALLAAALALVVGARLLRALVSPPLAWDALVYHDYIPATWVQTGRLLPPEWPDWGRFLGYYPHGGEIVWAWALLPLHADALLPLATLWVWSLVGAASFALARQLEAPSDRALWAALAVASIPAMLTEVTSGYVDAYVLAAFLLAFVGVLRLAAAPTSAPVVGRAGLAAMGFGLSAAGKLSGLPSWLGGLGLIALLVLSARDGARPRRLLAVAVAVAGALLPTAPGWLTAWRHTGSPVYPLQLGLFGRVLVAGNAELADVFSGRQLHIVDQPGNVARLLNSLLQPTLQRDDHLPFDFMNLGFAIVPMLLVGLVGVVQLLRRPGRRLALVAWLLLAALPVVALASPELLGTRTHLAWCLGRLIACFPATLIIVGAVVPMARLLLPLAVAGNVVLCAHVPFSAAQAEGALTFGGPLVAVVVAGAAFVRFTRGRRSLPLAATLLALGLALVGARLGSVRARLRQAIYAETADPSRPAYDMHSIMPYGAEAPIWRFIDDGAAHRLAVTFGWSGLGENLMRYPLLGSRLQNQLLYLPISVDGAVFDYRDLATPRAPPLSEDAWLARLRDANVDLVVDGGFHPPEERWLDAAPALFRLVAADATGSYRVYRVDTAELRRRVR